MSLAPVITRLARFAGRLRPAYSLDVPCLIERFRAEAALLRQQPDEAAQLRADVLAIVTLPHQSGFYAEAGVASALGFTLELIDRLRQAVLPLPPDNAILRSILLRIFEQPGDYIWVQAAGETAWLDLLDAIGFSDADADSPKVSAGDTAIFAALRANLLGAVRMLSHRLAGAALDRELLRAEPALERHASPFMAQNEYLLPLLSSHPGGDIPEADVRHLDVLLAQCDAVLVRVRRNSAQAGISLRLTYLMARLDQLAKRLRRLIALLGSAQSTTDSVQFLMDVLSAEQRRHRVGGYVAENLSLTARNVTERASHHGEHYIASDRAQWFAMGRSAAGGGVVIAVMALIKVQLALLHLPPLTEALAFGLNYALGFVLIHLLGFVVATKQPAMTAAAIAATLEESNPRKLDALGDLVQNVVRTQSVAVLGNVGLAIPTACVIAWAWIQLTGHSLAPEAKLTKMLIEVHPWHSAALLFAAVAAVGLFLSGLVAGYFDNMAIYHRLPERLRAMPALRGISPERRERIAAYMGEHHGAILGNVFFGFYLGLIGGLGPLTGLPLDIRHVAFSAANLGTAITSLPWPDAANHLLGAVLGVAGIASINLGVSFALALYVAILSRRLGLSHALLLGSQLIARFKTSPMAFFRPPARVNTVPKDASK
jgi:site-specific recombinase